MFFLVSKILSFLTIPLNWVFGLLGYSLLAKTKHARLLQFTSLLLLYFFSIELVLNPLFKVWEYPMVWYKDVPAEQYDAAIVLGGVCAPGKKPDDRTHFPGSPDRLMHALQLYKLGKVKKIIITGGSGELIGKKTPEATYLVNVLGLCEVNPADILVENKSKNTRENAAFTKTMLEKEFGVGRKHLLVTSAYHMRRSIACFQKADMNVTPFSVDSLATETDNILSHLLPNQWAMGKWGILIHEIIGYVSYWLMGYI
jgi:uncharacterized SAM-binding protein YcdF (DUF218 family)